VPADSGGTTINFDVLEHLKFTVMGSLEAHNGQWGAFTDFIYLDFGGDRSQTRKFTIGNSGLPVGTTADIDWNLKGVSWTVGWPISLRLQPGPSRSMRLGGAACSTFAAPAAGASPATSGRWIQASRTGSNKADKTLIDGIVGRARPRWRSARTVPGRYRSMPTSAPATRIALAGRHGHPLRVSVGRDPRAVARARLQAEVGRPGRKAQVQRADARRDLALVGPGRFAIRRRA
jgi:hypothetical protein